MQCLVHTILVALCLAGLARADVFYEEEVVNGGIGPQKTGARKTVKQIYLKGKKQKVHSQIEADKATAASLQKQGQRLDGSTILRLDGKTVYEIDNFRRVFTQEPLPAAKPVAQKAASTGPKPIFRVRELPDTTRILGILCQKVAADMRVRYYEPGTDKLKKENRYLYQAYMARDFPGLAEIEQFKKIQASQTSYPSLIEGGLEQLQGLVDDYDQLAEQMKVLQGFPMQSDLKGYVQTPGNEARQIFQLSRKVRKFSYSPLADSEFQLAKDLTKISK